MPAIYTPILGIIGLIFAALILRNILSRNAGEGRVAEIAQSIHVGAMVFMKREFRLIAGFALVIGLALFFFQDQAYAKQQSFAFFLGCLASSAAGFIGMFTATKANVRTALAAKNKGASEALTIAFFGGSVMGLTVASMGLLGLGGLFAYFQSHPEHLAEILEGFAMGASLVALFYRVGGGIFTKAADVGADLVGKVEAGIPEDDPRNPGVIADNVGDNVGDVAGMGSDIFESYCGAQIATVAIGATLGARMADETATSATASKLVEKLGATANPEILLQLPLILTTVGLICSILGILLVRTLSDKDPAKALRYGTIGSAFLFIVAT